MSGVKKIVVLGGTGNLGGATVRSLLEANNKGEGKFEVVALVRNPTDKKGLIVIVVNWSVNVIIDDI